MNQFYACILMCLVYVTQAAFWDGPPLHYVAVQEYEWLYLKRMELIWKLYKPVVETVDIPYDIFAFDDLGEGEYVAPIAYVEVTDDYVRINTRLRREKAYYVEGCSCCWPRVSYESGLSEWWKECAHALDNKWGGYFLSLCCMALTIMPDMALDGLYSFLYYPKDLLWKKEQNGLTSVYYVSEPVAFEKIAQTNEEGKEILRLGYNFLIKDRYFSLSEPYFWGTNFDKVACVVPGIKKLYILTPKGGVRMDVPQKLHDCFLHWK